MADRPKSVAAATPAGRAVTAADASASERIDARIAGLQDWRGAMLAHLRAVVRAASPDIVEDWKWNVPVWTCDGIVCTGEVYKTAVKLTFAKGASLDDPAALFNASLEGKVRRAIDVAEGGAVDAPALQALVRAAIEANRAAVPKTPKRRS